MTLIVLASSSPYRRALLDKLGIIYKFESPDIDESPAVNESARSLVLRLSKAKALALTQRHPDSLIIGSDQVAVLDGEILGKPLTHARATEQLLRSSASKVTFLTGLCLHNSATGVSRVVCERYSVQFRSLKKQQIENYLTREKPYDCAGSFKSEGLGISLFEKLEGTDPNTLVGLPLIALINLLNEEGVDVLR